MTWQNTAFLFPGQGSQAVGMVQSIARDYPSAGATFQEADDLLGYALSKLCWEGSAEELNQTLHTQPALYVAGIATWRALQEALTEPPQPAFSAGHSLGEFTALVAAGALSFADGLRLVQRRAELMQDAGAQSAGGVAAILGLDLDSVETLCGRASRETGEIVVIANDNCPGQVVISGSHNALDLALTFASEAGAKRAVKLPVSVAVHSPLMKPAGEQFAEAVANTPIEPAQIPLVANVSAQPITSVEDIRQELTQQITASVRWTESISFMQKAGINRYLELGPGGVLVGLVKRIDRQAERVSLETSEQLCAFVANQV